VKAFRLPLKIRCPAPCRALSLGLLLAVTACGYIPRPVEGVPPGAPWEALPLRKWLAEDRAEPRAIAFCAPPECRPGLAVGVIRLTARDAQITESLLKDPERLARALRPPADSKERVRTSVSVKRLKEGPFHGFAISLAPMDGRKRPAYGAALGRRSGDDLEVVLVIGDEAEAVRETVRQVAERELNS